MRRLDLNLLISLDVLLAEGSVTRAANRLGLSQPAISAQLRQLREMFDDPLLVPAARGMVPTVRAEHLKTPLRHLLADLTDLVKAHQAFEPASANRVFRIATSDAIQLTVCAPLLARLRRKAPLTRLAVFTAEKTNLDQHLTSGELDLVLVTPSLMPKSAKARTLLTESFLCVVRPGHPTIGATLDLDVFCAQEHLLVSTDGGGFYGIVDESLAAIGRQRRVVLSVPNFLVVPEMLLASDLIATVPAGMARRWRDRLIVLTPPCEIPGFPIQMGWHPRSQADPALTWLRGEIVAACSSSNSTK